MEVTIVASGYVQDTVGCVLQMNDIVIVDEVGQTNNEILAGT